MPDFHSENFTGMSLGPHPVETWNAERPLIEERLTSFLIRNNALSILLSIKYIFNPKRTISNSNENYAYFAKRA